MGKGPVRHRPLAPPSEFAEFGRCGAELREYLLSEVELRRAAPGDDLISTLIRAEEQRALTADQLVVFVIMLLVAGNVTTTNLINNAVLALLANPGALGTLARDPSLVPRAVEETLRYDTPVQSAMRVTRTATAAG